MKTKAFFGIAGAVLISAAAAFAHSGAKGIVKERMEAMSEMAKASKSLARLTRDLDPYDAARVRAHARTLRAHAGQDLTRMFPEGSTADPSEAATAIWQDWDRFSAIAVRLAVLAEGLELAAANGVSGTPGRVPANATPAEVAKLPVDTVFGGIAATCKSCHADFRIDK